MPARPLWLRRIAPLLVLTSAVAAAILLVRWWPNWQSTRLAEAWRAELESAEPDRIPVLFDQLIDLGDAGLEPVVSALASPREQVRRQAAAKLRRLADQWEVADVSARSVAAGKLATLLARHVDDLPADARQTAASLVQQMLAWTTDAEFVDRTQLVLDCEAVLLAADTPGDPSQAAAAAEVAHRSPPPPIDRDLASLARLPGGGLAIEPSQPPRLPPVDEPPASSEVGDPNEPRLLLDGRGDELPPAPLPAVHPEDAAVLNPTSARAQGNNRARPANNVSSGGGGGGDVDALSLNDQANIHAATADAPPSPSTIVNSATPREMSLIRLLQSEPSIAAEAQRQLRAIGYGEREIALAECIAHPDVDFRLRLVEAIPRTAGIRPRRWLEMLLEDDDARVRLAAIAQLATSGDASLVESLRRRALADPDPDVRRYAERLREARPR